MSDRKQKIFPIPDVALDGDIAILGRKGGGKTITAKGIVEHLLDMHERPLILDPLGGWAGLRTSADGRSPGYPIAIFGGEHADLPLDPAAAVPMARLIAEEKLPAIVDLSDLTKRTQTSFLIAFLHELRRVNRNPLTLVLEEADVFAPQNPQHDDSKELLGEIDWIARRGRARGFRLITVTQRPARLAKDVLTQCSLLIAHKLPSPQDRDAVKAWVEGNGDRELSREVFDTLAALDIGEAWVWSTVEGWSFLGRLKFPMIKTMDTTATPKRGESRAVLKTLAEVDVGPIKAALEAAAADRKKPVKTGENAKESVLEIGQAKAIGYSAGFADAKNEITIKYRKALADLGVEVHKLAIAAISPIETIKDWGFDLGMEHEGIGESAVGVTREAVAAEADDVNRRSTTQARRKREGTPGAAAKMLAVLDTNPPVWRTWPQTATLAGLKARGGHFNEGRKWLIESGHLAIDGDCVAIKAPSVGAPTGKISRNELVAMWMKVLSGAAPRILEYLASTQHAWKREDIASALGLEPRGGYWNSAWKELRDNNIVEMTGDVARLSELFR